MNKVEITNISMNGILLGKLALTPDGLCAFEYDASYLQTGISISPFLLPLKSGVFVAKHRPFNGNFGVFADSLPDGWGSLLLDRYLRVRGVEVSRLTNLERLSLIGTTGRGALEYLPEDRIESNVDFMGFDKLAHECEKILTTDYDGESLDALYQYAGSSGGARPKIFIKIDDKQWLVKFKSTVDPRNVGQWEYEYSLLAKRCGIQMPETRLFEKKYFGVERFDRISGTKVHTISAAGLLGADYRIPSLDYLTLLKATLQLTKDVVQVYNLFRQMVFNVAISNRDDHAKNFSFQLIGSAWKLSPAYDLLPSLGFNGFHTTTINNNGDPTIQDLKAVAKTVGLSAPRAKDIIDQVITICSEAKMSRYDIP